MPAITTILAVAGAAAAIGGTGYGIASSIDASDKADRAAKQQALELKARREAEQAQLAEQVKEKQNRFRLLQGGASTKGGTVKTSQLGVIGDDQGAVKKIALGL